MQNKITGQRWLTSFLTLHSVKEPTNERHQHSIKYVDNSRKVETSDNLKTQKSCRPRQSTTEWLIDQKKIGISIILELVKDIENDLEKSQCCIKRCARISANNNACERFAKYYTIFIIAITTKNEEDIKIKKGVNAHLLNLSISAIIVALTVPATDQQLLVKIDAPNNT